MNSIKDLNEKLSCLIEKITPRDVANKKEELYDIFDELEFRINRISTFGSYENELQAYDLSINKIKEAFSALDEIYNNIG